MSKTPKLRRSPASSPPGKLSRAAIKKAVASIHVFPSSAGQKWEVKEIGVAGLHKKFASKQEAVAFAQDAATKKHLAGVCGLSHFSRGSSDVTPTVQ